MKTNKKQNQEGLSSIEKLPKKLKERIVNINDMQTSINTTSTTGNVNFTSNETTNDSSTTQTEKSHLNNSNSQEKQLDDVPDMIPFFINFSFEIKSQLKAQGHNFDKNFIKLCEEIRVKTLALNENGIITDKQERKDLSKLNKTICQHIVNENFAEESFKIKSINI